MRDPHGRPPSWFTLDRNALFHPSPTPVCPSPPPSRYSHVVRCHAVLELPPGFPGLLRGYSRPAWALVLELLEEGSLCSLMHRQLLAPWKFIYGACVPTVRGLMHGNNARGFSRLDMPAVPAGAAGQAPCKKIGLHAPTGRALCPTADNEQAMQWSIQTAGALAYLHACSPPVIHRVSCGSSRYPQIYLGCDYPSGRTHPNPPRPKRPR